MHYEGASNSSPSLKFDQDGWFLLEDPLSKEQQVSKRVRIGLDENGLLVTNDGYHIMGKSGGYFEHELRLHEDGSWESLGHSETFLSITVPIGSNPFYADYETELELVPLVQNKPIIRFDYLGEPEQPYDYEIGQIYYSETEPGIIESIKGWHAFGLETLELINKVMDAAAKLNTYNRERIYFSLNQILYGHPDSIRLAPSRVSNLTTSTIQFETPALVHDYYDEIAEAIGKDIYTTLFPNSEKYPHGLQPKTQTSGQPYRSFTEEILYDITSDFSADFPVSEWIDLIHSTLPQNQQEALNRIESTAKDQLPSIARYAISEDGSVKAFLDNGDSAIVSVIMGMHFESPENLTLIESQERAAFQRFLKTTSAAELPSNDENAYNLHYASPDRIGSVSYTYNQEELGPTSLISWHSIPGISYRIDGWNGADDFVEYNLNSSTSRQTYPVHLDPHAEKASLYQVSPLFNFNFETVHSDNTTQTMRFRSSSIRYSETYNQIIRQSEPTP
ncbi:hypothetical protein MLD52_16410 [Puniceicoccaceae bacterium K14]|nr:hypothetical protein [Puniceicoccaceae bacterium K14]